MIDVLYDYQFNYCLFFYPILLQKIDDMKRSAVLTIDDDMPLRSIDTEIESCRPSVSFTAEKDREGSGV